MQTFAKTCLALLVGLLVVQAAQAQAAFGVKAGVNISNPSISIDNADIETSGVTNLQLGLFLDLPVGAAFSIQPEFNYIARGYQNDDAVVVVNVFNFEKRNLGYLDLGALAKLRFGQQDGGVGFYLGAGPFVSYAISGQEERDGNDDDLDFDETELKRTDVRVAGALGLTFGSDFRFFIDGRYVAGLGDASDNDGIEIRNNDIGITAGVMVPLGQ